ncbi:MAG: hypothetical protein RL077_2346 [Verrucomicrobiota bacterium]
MAALALACATGLLAQTAPAPSTAARTTATVAADAVKLNPFEVVETKDSSFMSTNAGSASRMALDLNDTPIAYSVINREFIEALGIHDLQEAATWSTNTTSFADGNGADTFNHPIVVRGNQTSENYSATGVTGAQRNFYSNVGTADSYAVESYDFSRGPNAALFGTGNLGGQQLTQTKRARLDAPSTVVNAEYGSWSHRRVALDYNRPISERAGIRVNIVTENSKGWRMMQENQQKGLTFTGSFKLTPTTDIKLDMSTDQALRHNPTTLLFDVLSGWDGSTVFRGPITNAMLSATATVGTANPLGQTLTFSGEPQGVDRLGANYYVYDVASGAVMNWQNSAITRKADATSRVPMYSSSAPNGVAFVRGTGPNFGYTTANAAADEMNFLHNPPGLPADRFTRALTSSRFRIPSERFTPEPDGWYYNQRSKDAQIAITQRIGEKLFIDVGGDTNRTYNKTPGSALNFRFARLDLNQLKPDGSPNSNFLDIYADSNLAQNNSWTNFDTARVNIGYATDLGKWGNYVFNINGSMNNRQSKTRNYSMSLMLNADQRLWAGGADAVKLRTYWYNPSSRQFNEPSSVDFTQVDWTNPNSPVIQPTAKRTTSWILSAWSERYVNTRNITLQTSAKYFGGKLAATLAIRRDSSLNKTKSSRNTGDLPANWDGNTILWRPDAPADYWTMTYVPKNQTTGVATSAKPIIVTGNRPRTTIDGLSVRNPFFLTDRFRDDYNAPPVTASSTNRSTGFVWHATPNIHLSGSRKLGQVEC